MKRKKCGSNCCEVEAVVTVDERGQIVIPKETRQKARLKSGDKFALALITKEEEVCCIVLTKLEFLNAPIKSLLVIKKGS
ncbi:MAG: HgcAB-associated protein [Candidatus Eisenbacteria bacterium]|nr:HgcAB-associated protein [Candidatus Eisenbacteria bacterium]